MKKLILFTFTLVSCFAGNAQKDSLKYKLYKLEGEIIKGDFGSLKELTKYIDDTSFVQEFLGYHSYPNTARGIATRIIEENFLFAEKEILMDSTISAQKFLNFLNNRKVVFDDLTGMFLINEISERTTVYQLKKLSVSDFKKVDSTAVKSPYPSWYYESQIDGFLLTKNPEALKWIASSWFKHRSRFNRYYFDDEEFLDLIWKLTRLDIGVTDEKGEVTFLYKDDYFAKARLNYLIYWVNHYQDYKWNEEKEYFENTREGAVAKTEEDILFSLLNSKDDSIAHDAFVRLAELDTNRVRILAEEYEKNRMDRNFHLPTFPYRFLKQMVILTQYCRNNRIKYKVSGWLLDSLEKLKGWPEFPVEYRLENNIVNRLTVEDVTMVEYFGLVYQQEWSSTYSIGRILDKFYSRRWKEIISEEKRLLLFLKKAKLFDRLGIIGNAGKFLRKFQNGSPELFARITQIFNSTDDPDIKESAGDIISQYGHSKEKEKGNFVPTIKNAKYGVANLKDEYLAIIKKYKTKSDRRWPLKQLFARVNYRQLGEAVRILRDDNNSEKYDDRYWILKNDFGLEIDSYSEQDINNFLVLIDTRTEYEAYKHYLQKKELGCLDKNGDFIFEKVYDVLKYDVVDAFVGGGGGRRETGIYALIKLLEIKFGTRLGFPEKFCESEGVYSCNCIDRAKLWMQFLEEKGLVIIDKMEPPSISYNE